MNKRPKIEDWESGKIEIPDEFEIEISESDIVKEKSNLEMWEEIFFDESRDPDEKAAVLNSLDYDPTQAYEKIVEGK